jgi:hypothetical protein
LNNHLKGSKHDLIKEIQKYNEMIWEQISWGNSKVAQLLEESLEEELR